MNDVSRVQGEARLGRLLERLTPEQVARHSERAEVLLRAYERRREHHHGPVVIHQWMCPWCDDRGMWADGEVCHHCFGFKVTSDVAGWDEAELTPAPRPPAVMKAPCVDCAFRPGSPETNVGHPGAPGGPPGPETPFFCHHGMVRVGDGYTSPATVGNLPLGAMVCAGWWAFATDEKLPAKPFRDPGGSDRSTEAG